MSDDQTNRTNEIKELQIGSTEWRKARFLEALHAQACNISKACEAADIARATYYEWRNTDPNFKAACDAEYERMIDVAESVLLRNIMTGKEASTFFFLKCQAKHRGYVERQEITGRDGEPIVVNFIPAKPDAG